MSEIYKFNSFKLVMVLLPKAFITPWYSHTNFFKLKHNTIFNFSHPKYIKITTQNSNVHIVIKNISQTLYQTPCSCSLS